MSIIYKIVPAALWGLAAAQGRFEGAPADLADGFIHFSTGAQVRETARKHFAGVPDLLLVAVQAEDLGTALCWQPSRGGALFPHLYAPLELSAVRRVAPLVLGPDGLHRFPPDLDRRE